MIVWSTNNEMCREGGILTRLLQIDSSIRYAYRDHYFFSLARVKNITRCVANHLTLLGFKYTMEEVSDERETGVMTHGITYNYS